MKHITVLKDEAIKYLNLKDDGIYVDLTLGGGGHTLEILKKVTKGHVFAFDQDEYAISKAKENLKEFNNITYIHDNFRNFKNRLIDLGIEEVDGILMDLGMSSFQIDDEKRGFSYLKDTNLDMRMDQRSNKTAKEILNNYSYEDLSKIFYLYGEEQNASKITNLIIKNRPLETTTDLVKITDYVNKGQKGHSAKKVFQALRIEVNDEISSLNEALDNMIDILKIGGTISIISFHSLEDRIVKNFFKENQDKPWPKGVIMPGMMEGRLYIQTKKGIRPTDEELKNNSRSKSAILRAATKKS